MTSVPENKMTSTSHFDLSNKLYIPKSKMSDSLDSSNLDSSNLDSNTLDLEQVNIVAIVITKYTIEYILPYPFEPIVIKLDNLELEYKSLQTKNKGLLLNTTEHIAVGTVLYRCNHDKIDSCIIEKVYITIRGVEYLTDYYGRIDSNFASKLRYTKAEAVAYAIEIINSINIDSVYSQENMSYVFSPERMDRIIKNNNFTKNSRHDRCWEIGNKDYRLMFYLDDVNMYPIYKFNHFVSNHNDWVMETELYKYIPSSYNILKEEECIRCGLVDYYDVEFGSETWLNMPKVIHHFDMSVTNTDRSNNCNNLVDFNFETIDFINFRLSVVHTLEIQMLSFINFW